MIKTSLIVFFSVIFILLYNAFSFGFSSKKKSPQPENNRPVIKIVSPENNSAISRGAQVHYSITVSDKEDGESKFDEINPKEVLMQVKYLDDTSTVETEKNHPGKDAPGLAAIRTSNCFNCHAFESKVIGPGFSEIAKRYQPSAQNFALLEKRIREGSTGVWGKVAMPTHPELSAGQIQSMVKWIMQNRSENEVHYFPGTDGAFKIPADLKSSFILLSASYTDHGINNTGARLKGQDVILLRVK